MVDINKNKLGGNAKEILRSKVKRILKLDEEKQLIQDDISDIYKELKGEGFNAAAVRGVVAEIKKKRKDREKFEEIEEDKDLYRIALDF
jgi:uncharacterized protein (UPF0335 family)